MRRLFVILCFGLLLAGCAQPNADKTIPADDRAPTTTSSPGGVVNGQEPVSDGSPPAARTFGRPVAAAACRNCFEPTIAADPDGRLFVADGAGTTIGVSEDGGRSWTTVEPPPVPSDFRASRADAIVQVAPSGRLYWSALVFSQAILLDDGIQVAWSDDGARTWSGNVHLSPATQSMQVIEPDRQWLGFAPDGTLYLTYNQAPTGIWFARSDDEGRTWKGWTRVAPSEERKGGFGQSGPPVVDSSGRVYVPACDGDNARTLVFHSDNQGDSWTSAAVEGSCEWFPILAARAGSLALSVQPATAMVTVSPDRGTTFLPPTSWGSPSTSAGWPILTDDGELVLTWFKTEGEAVTLHVTRGEGLVRGSDVVVARIPVDGGLPGLDSRPALTDFASAALLPDGRLAVVYMEGTHVYVGVESKQGASTGEPDASGMGS